MALVRRAGDRDVRAGRAIVRRVGARTGRAGEVYYIGDHCDSIGTVRTWGGTDMSDATLAEALATGGWVHIELDLDGVVDKPAFMDRCARTLDLPDYFGRNWDALADCLTDLSWAPPARGRLIVVTGWREFALAVPNDWTIAQEVFTEAVDHWRGTENQLRVVLALGGGS
ncbi:barstar family protein [Streptomyces sp. NPDC002643]